MFFPFFPTVSLIIRSKVFYGGGVIDRGGIMAEKSLMEEIQQVIKELSEGRREVQEAQRKTEAALQELTQLRKFLC